MKCCVKYTHPANGNTWYFKDLRNVDGVLRPVGYMRYRRHLATVFHTKHDAMVLVNFLKSIGYSAYIC